MSEKIVWILTDNRTGNNNQVIGLAENIGLPYLKKELKYNKFAKLPNKLKLFSFLGLDKNLSTDLSPPYPDLIISAGRKAAAVAYRIKKLSQGKTKIVQLMDPEINYKYFDLIILPEHDNADITKNPNIITSFGALHKITDANLLAARDVWQERFKDLPQTKISVLVGGTTKDGIFTNEHAKELAIKASDFAKKHNAGLLITTSRRTPKECIQILKDNILVPYYLYDAYNPEGENPYIGLLAVGDIIIASGDSVSMCTESLSTGKPVYIYAPPELSKKKHQLFHQRLLSGGYVKYLNNDATLFAGKKINDTQRIANFIKERFL